MTAAHDRIFVEAATFAEAIGQEIPCDVQETKHGKIRQSADPDHEFITAELFNGAILGGGDRSTLLGAISNINPDAGYNETFQSCSPLLLRNHNGTVDQF
ncbi:hypothetical protein PMIN06_005850 [Paraphaeosphaeria minitans]